MEIEVRAPETPLADGVVMLRTLNPADASDFARAVADSEIARRAYHHPPTPTLEGALEFIALAETKLQHGDAVILGVFDSSDGHLVGKTMLHAIDFHNRLGEIGFWVAPWARGQGVGFRALALKTRWALSDLGLERLQAFTDADNLPAQRLMERCGFRRERLHRGMYRVGDRRVDQASFGLLREDMHV